MTLPFLLCATPAHVDDLENLLKMHEQMVRFNKELGEVREALKKSKLDSARSSDDTTNPTLTDSSPGVAEDATTIIPDASHQEDRMSDFYDSGEEWGDNVEEATENRDVLLRAELFWGLAASSTSGANSSTSGDFTAPVLEASADGDEAAPVLQSSTDNGVTTADSGLLTMDETETLDEAETLNEAEIPVDDFPPDDLAALGYHCTDECKDEFSPMWSEHMMCRFELDDAQDGEGEEAQAKDVATEDAKESREE
ncbi:hypothetical protein LTS18_009255 [Coniosporium uncinatum]|uniref:Uncharacterized protein n=1 Tax=Coniosporium uncinatum TaxID=93489 RepID=A0ACC3DCV2_9PEZI|nr:hypothetical protein LTS18_009255 [Coniosporium uncinatum]